MDPSGRRPLTPAQGAVERLVQADRRLVLASLTLVAALAWIYLAALAARMSNGDMRLMGLGDMRCMADAAMSTPQPWTPTTFGLMLLMWWVMMLGMMIPSAAPMILLFGRVQRRQLADRSPHLVTSLFATSYLTIWGVFSVVATAVQWGLNRAALLMPMSMTASSTVAAVLLAVGGLYQLTPVKRACLRRCRAPAEFLALHWRKGALGAWRMGFAHGAYCVGCCWALMALLFVGGVMNLAWVAALAVLVLLEKVFPRGETIAVVAGVAMLAAAIWIAGAAIA